MSAMNQPRHRRPSYLRTPEGRQVYLQSDFMRKQGPIIACNSDSFSYNDNCIKKWEMPADIAERIPADLRAMIEGWQAAGAAVCTGLHRLDDKDREAIYRGWPVKKTGHLSRTTSHVASDVQSDGAISRSISNIATAGSRSVGEMQTSPLTQSAPKQHATDHGTTSRGLSRLQTNLASYTINHGNAVADTPPYSPEDALMPKTPISDIDEYPGLDALKLNDRLDILAGEATPSPSPVPVVRSTPKADFEESAWEHFIGEYDEEMRGIKVDSIVRFRHMRRSINQNLNLKHAGATSPISEDISEDFSIWWEGMGNLQDSFETKVDRLESPDLEDVKAERKVLGLHV